MQRHEPPKCEDVTAQCAWNLTNNRADGDKSNGVSSLQNSSLSHSSRGSNSTSPLRGRFSQSASEVSTAPKEEVHPYSFLSQAPTESVIEQHGFIACLDDMDVYAEMPPWMQPAPPNPRNQYTQRRKGGALSAVQLFGRLAVVETHTLWYFGHHLCLVVGFDALGIWHFWMFTLFHPFLLFCTHFLPISTTSTLFLG